MKRLALLPVLALSLLSMPALAASEDLNTQAVESFDHGGNVDSQATYMARIRCESRGFSTTVCRVRGDMRIQRVQLVRQLSLAPCNQGSSWGYDARGVWVSRGCRADFRAIVFSRDNGYPGYPGRPGHGGGWGNGDGNGDGGWGSDPGRY
jgi:hypothetical protein